MVNLIKRSWRLLLENPELFMFHVARKLKVLNRISDKKYLECQFKAVKRYPLDLKNPQTFNEKLQWLKLYDRNPLYTKLVDKYAVREYVKEKLGEEYLIPLVGGPWLNSVEINFDNLPERFVLKCTHDSGSAIVCKNKADFNIRKARKKLDRALRTNYYYGHREWPYKNVKPQIIAEKFLGDGERIPDDYKFFTFGGEIDCVMVCKDRDRGHPWFYFYSMDWERKKYQLPELEKEDEIDRPKDLDKMAEVVKKLAKEFRHVRIDLYYENEKIYFGEITLYNQSGLDTDITYETDWIWGQRIKLPQMI